MAGWATDGDGEYDYGAIVLGESLGDRTGWFGFGNWPSLDGVRANISGYPGDKPAGTQWYAAGLSTRRAPGRCSTTSTPPEARAIRRLSVRQRIQIRNRHPCLWGRDGQFGHPDQPAVFDNIKTWKQASEA